MIPPAKRLLWYDLLGVNLFWLALNIRNNANGKVFQPYLVAHFVSPDAVNTAVGALNTAGLVIAMLVQPVMGILSDRNTSRFGRRRPFIFIGALLDLLFMGLMVMAGSYWMLLAVVLLQQFSANISHGPLQALIPDLVPAEQHETASAIKSIFELLPTIIVGAVIAQIVEAGQFTLAVIAAGAALLAIMLLTMILVKEKPIIQKPDIPLTPSLLRVLGMLAGILAGALAGILAGGVIGGLCGLAAWPYFGKQVAWLILVGVGGLVAMPTAVVVGVWVGTLLTIGSPVRRRPAFSWWVVNRLMFLAAIYSIPVFAPFFLMYAFSLDIEQATGRTGILIAVVGACIILNALLSIRIVKFTGEKKLLAISGIMAAASTAILLSTVWLPSMAMIYLAGLILGSAGGLFFTTNWAVGTRLVPAEQAGRYLGVSNLAGAGAGMIGTGMAGWVADTLNRGIPGLGYFFIFASYGVLFLLSIAALKGIKQR